MMGGNQYYSVDKLSLKNDGEIQFWKATSMWCYFIVLHSKNNNAKLMYICDTAGRYELGLWFHF